ncbi:hypothetical protein KIN20_032791 [Parelaphostrongylus tenuis]|uniref:Uncharacterized protein n=1 Tax=Parelaphostrongylus tenuis TaxID=148309 RepID=A0AAD5R7Q4_PARTN|nr:hypothetical protein KIN20_032791 [Parelaphostrongylus tenuis]
MKIGVGRFTGTYCQLKRRLTPALVSAPEPLQWGLVTSTSLQSHPASRQRKAPCLRIDKEGVDRTGLRAARLFAVQS